MNGMTTWHPSLVCLAERIDLMDMCGLPAAGHICLAGESLKRDKFIVFLQKSEKLRVIYRQNITSIF